MTDTAPLPPESDTATPSAELLPLYLRRLAQVARDDGRPSIALNATGARAVADELERLRAEIAEKDKEVERLRTGAPGKLHRICDALAEQADESPFTREEWDRADQQTAELNRDLTAARAERDAAVALLNEISPVRECARCGKEFRMHEMTFEEGDEMECLPCNDSVERSGAAAIKKQES